MRYLAIILLFLFTGAKAQEVKMVNGQIVPLTQEEIVKLQAQRAVADSLKRDSATTRKDRYELEFTDRKERLEKLMVYMAVKFNDGKFKRFVEDTRNERGDYPYAPDSLIIWFTDIFLTKNYGTGETQMQQRALKILRKQE